MLLGISRACKENECISDDLRYFFWDVVSVFVTLSFATWEMFTKERIWDKIITMMIHESVELATLQTFLNLKYIQGTVITYIY